MSIYIRKVLTSTGSKFGKVKKHGNVWNQAHACKFRHKVLTNIAKHYKKHKSEAEVKEIEKLFNSLGKRHKTVMAMWDKIRNRSDHEHNLKVIAEETGQMTCLASLFVCVEVLRPSQPNGVMSSAVSLPNHMFTGQA